MKKILLLSFLLFSSCNGDDGIVTPTVAGPFPSPSPTATPTPRVTLDPNDPCYHTSTKIVGDAYVAGLGPKQIFGLTLIPLHNSTVLDPNCPNYVHTAGWSAFGPCTPVGVLNALEFKYYCTLPGILNVVATHGPFTVPYRVVVAE